MEIYSNKQPEVRYITKFYSLNPQKYIFYSQNQLKAGYNQIPGFYAENKYSTTSPEPLVNYRFKFDYSMKTNPTQLATYVSNKVIDVNREMVVYGNLAYDFKNDPAGDQWYHNSKNSLNGVSIPNSSLFSMNIAQQITAIFGNNAPEYTIGGEPNKSFNIRYFGTVRVSWDSTAGDNYWDVTFPANSKETQIISFEDYVFYRIENI